MFNLGFTELLILGVLALIFIGPKELPEVARFVGRMLNEFRRATSDLSSNILNPPAPKAPTPDQEPSPPTENLSDHKDEIS